MGYYNRDEQVRTAAVQALWQMPMAEARPLLERTEREDASTIVRAQAAAALAALGK